jgi:hypothetical protein
MYRSIARPVSSSISRFKPSIGFSFGSVLPPGSSQTPGFWTSFSFLFRVGSP